MNEVTFITESVEVPFETIRNKWGVAKNASGLAMMQKIFQANIGKEVITMISKKFEKLANEDDYEMPQCEFDVLLAVMIIANRYQDFIESDEDNPFVYTEDAKREDRLILATACEKFLNSIAPFRKEVITMASKKVAKPAKKAVKAPAKKCCGKCKK